MSDLPKIGTIMLVDDDQVDQMMYKRVIDRSGLVRKIISFQYPDKALEFLKAPDCGEIDVLLLDINMPRLNGFEFLERAVAEVGPAFAKVVVVMLTTSLDPKDKERADSFSIVKAFLNKPLTAADLEYISSLLLDPK
ncbi:response regulator [Roseobacter sp. GAI101]|uniref:response regulator n=1 Tax=Roseobacter sp. (strain GAI101) TaxID=391589 RepID=UPI0003269B50|nr:response regulator [Roseobacter sp. GAI101]